jgi:hypothetical protein
MNEKDFCLYPLKLKALDLVLGLKRRKTRFRQKLQTTSHLQSPARILWDLSHYTVTPHAL